MARVSEAMNRNFAVVSPSASIVEVARKMGEYETGIVTVCDQAKLRGIITEEDIISAVVATERNPKRENAASLMQNHLPKTIPGADITEAAKLMASHKLRFLPVVERGKLVGMLTLSDLIRESPALAFMVMTRSFGDYQGESKSARQQKNSSMAFAF